MIKLIKNNESWIKVDCDTDQAINISDDSRFSFYAQGYQWSPKYKSGIWDGRIKLFNSRNRLLPQGLLQEIVNYLQENHLQYKVDPSFKVKGVNLSEKWICEFVKDALQCKFVPRDYQIAAVQRIFKMRKSINLLPTASGKSFVFYIVINILKFLNPERKILMIVPSTNLVEQMNSDFCEYAEDWCNYSENIHKIYGGKEKDTDKFLCISTWQSLQNIKGTKWFQQWDTVIVDEVHSVSTNKSGGKNPGNVISQIIGKCDRADFRVGLTGSLADSAVDKLQLKGLFGPIKKITNTKKLIDEGYLSNLQIKSFILKHRKSECRLCVKMSYQNENEFIRGSVYKLNFIQKLALSRKGNTLILFKSIEYGKKIVKILEDKGKTIYYVDGQVKTEDREQIRQLTENGKNVIIVASYATYSTGINITNLVNIILAESMKSSIKIIQSIGRVLRKHKLKETAVLYDIVDDLIAGKRKNYCVRHYESRKQIYKSEQFVFTEKRFNI